MMATGFDELVEQLLYDVALTGSQGLGADELESAVKGFYKSRKPAKPTEAATEEDMLFSDAPSASSVVVDEAFLSAVWDWLEKHPEIEIRTLVNEDGASSQETPDEPAHAEQRIFTTEERTWQVIAGHGVDYSRLPRRSFDCLSVIAAHGPSGVLQPVLTQLTGQDKRSVPGRTDFLAESGYIVKLQAYDGKHKTSLLKLRKFAEADGTAKPISALERTRMDLQVDNVPGPDDFNSNKTFDEIIQMLNDNGGIVAIIDLCRAYKLRKHTAIKRDFLRSLDRLVESGCTRQVKAQIESGNSRYATCLQLVRVPTEKDRELFVGNSSQKKTHAGHGPDDQADKLELANGDVLVDGEDQVDSEDDADDVVQRTPPQWTPDIPLNNLVFNIIEKAGPAGISSMDLHKQLTGPFWKKGLDDLLLRLTDVWGDSQPPHLRHLAIVRDTDVQGKSAHFQFRTFHHFEKAVELGLTAWEAVVSGSEGAAKNAGKPASLSKEPDLDQYGFPKLNPKLFVNEEGRATLAQCAAYANKGRQRSDGPGSTPKKHGPKPKPKTPLTLTPIGRKKRKDADIEEKATETPNAIADVGAIATSAQTPDVTITRRKKRKDAGVKTDPTGPRSPNRRRKSTSTAQDEDKDETNGSPGDNDSNAVRSTRSISGSKRSADEAQVDLPRRRRKSRKLEDMPAPSSGSSEVENAAQSSGQDTTSTRPSQETPPSSLVTFNSPSAVRSRFEGWNRSGRKPNTKIATIKSDHLRNLVFFRPESIQQDEQEELQNVELAALESSDEVPRNVIDTVDLSAEPPNKKQRLEDDTPAATPLVKKKRGRPPKAKVDPIKQPAAGLNVATPSSRSVIGVENIGPAMPVSLVAKLPLRRSLLQSFVQEGSKANAEPVESNREPSRIVSLPLPKIAPDAIVGNKRKFSEPSNGYLASGSSAHISATQATSASATSKKSLTVKLSLPASALPNNSNTDRPVETPGAPSAAVTLEAPLFGLNIVRPYLAASAHKNSQYRDDSTSLNNAPVTRIDAQVNSTNITEVTSSEPARENDVSAPATDGVDNDFDTLSELQPADIDLDENYRGTVNVKAGTPRQGGFIHLRRKKIVMETMDKAGGVFPGDHEMWYPFTTAWQKTYAHLPDRRTVENTVNSLVKDGQLNKFSFTFRDKNGKTIQRHILIKPDISPSSEAVREVQRLIIDSYPFRYLPKQVNIAKHLRDRARQVPVTQGGTKRRNDDDADEKDPTYTPFRSKTSAPSTARRTGSGVSFDLRPQAGVIQTPKVQKLASFTPRSILKIKDVSQQPIDIEDDDFESESASETSTESDEDDEPLREISPEQAALQGSFGLDRYQHTPTRAPRARQGSRAMRTLKVGSQVSSAESTPASALRRLIYAAVPSEHFAQIFHGPTGTFGTLFKQKYRGGRPRKKVDSPPPTIGSLYSVPQNLEDIRQRAKEIGHKSANVKDSRFHQYKNEVDGVKEWEQSMIDEDRTMAPMLGTVFINHGLMQPHEVSSTPDANFGFEFVDGSLKPFDLENQRKKQQSKGDAPAAQRPTVSTASFVPQYMSPYAPTYSPTYAFPNAASGGQTPSSTSTPTPPLRFMPPAMPPLRPILSLGSGNFVQYPATPPIPIPRVPLAQETPKRQYTYRTRNKATRRPSMVDSAAAQFEDRDSDGDYRPARAISVKKKHAGLKQPHYTKFGSEQFKRLALAVTIARLICGGTASQQTMSYEAVEVAFGSKYGIEELKHHWQLPRKFGYDLAWAKRVQKVMYEPFLKAYENGELPSVDFDDLHGTDWPGLLNWAVDVVLPLVEGSNVEQLPIDRSNVQAIMIDDSEADTDHTNVHEITTVTDVSEEDQGPAPIRPRGHTKSKASSALDQSYILEKSWIRAVMTTQDEHYDKNVAGKKLGSIPPLNLEKATQEMLDTKMIKWKKLERQQPGRSYEISSYALSQLERWPTMDVVDYLESLASARESMLQHFQQFEVLDLAADVSEAQMIVLTNMVAQGHLSMAPILPDRNDDLDAPWPKLSKWGHINGTYNNENREVPSLDIKVVYKKTPLFKTEHDLKFGMAIPAEAAVYPGESNARIPLWIDINGNVMADIWSKVVKSILYLLVHTPGCTTKSIERAHDSKLWVWEIEIALAWMEKAGLALRGKDEVYGWRAGMWWYCASYLLQSAPDKSKDVEAVHA